MRPRILFLVPADYEDLRRKGTDRMIQERDENGFFERVITVHPLASRARMIDLDAVHRIHEFPLGRALGSAPSGIWARLSAPFRLIAVAATIIRIGREERVDLVRANDPYLMGALAWWVSRSLRVPFCVSLHADYDKRFSLTPKTAAGRLVRRIASLIPSFVVPRADMVLPIREHLVKSMEAAGAERTAIRVIPHGIDLSAFSAPLDVDARGQFGIQPDAAVVSFVGRLSGDNYGVDVTDVVERVARRRHDVVFVLMGEGPDQGRVRQRLAQTGLAHAVKLLPFQSYDRVVALRRISVASLCLMGGFSLIEACAAGSVPIAYDVEWHRELVQDGVTGFLVREHDVEAVAEAVEYVVTHPAKAAAMGDRARRAAFERHDRQMTSKIKQACYTEILTHRRLPAR